jgi:hypothetical protein
VKGKTGALRQERVKELKLSMRIQIRKQFFISGSGSSFFISGSGSSFLHPDPDPAFYIWIRIQGAQPMRINADPDPDPRHTLKSQKVEFFHEKYSSSR